MEEIALETVDVPVAMQTRNLTSRITIHSSLIFAKVEYDPNRCSVVSGFLLLQKGFGVVDIEKWFAGCAGLVQAFVQELKRECWK